MTKLRSLAAAALMLAALSSGAMAATPAKRYLMVFEPGLSPEAKLARIAKRGMTLLKDLPRLDLAIVERRKETFAAQALSEDVEADFYAKWLHCDASSLEDAAGCWGSLKKAKLSEPAPKSDPLAEVPWGVKRVGAPSAWVASSPRSMGSGVKVAVIDTGVDCSHPDIGCNQSSGFTSVTPEEPAPGQAPKTPTSWDDNGHGTHVAGTIAGRWNGSGVVGVAPLATIIPVKVLDADGGGMVSDIVKGIYWAVDNGVQVINMSLGSAKGSKALERAVKYAYAKGVVIVAAAGNEGPAENTVGYPAAYPETIAVAAIDDKDAVPDFSSRGRQVVTAAPGDGILSTVPGSRYAKLSGTSMAAPHVAGLAALAIGAGFSGPAAVRSAIVDSATHVCQINWCPGPSLQGRGVADAGKFKPHAPTFAMASVSTYRVTATP